jgi:hypothetical protein
MALTSQPQMLALYHSLSNDEMATTLILRLDQLMVQYITVNTLAVVNISSMISVHVTNELVSQLIVSLLTVSDANGLSTLEVTKNMLSGFEVN